MIDIENNEVKYSLITICFKFNIILIYFVREYRIFTIKKKSIVIFTITYLQL